MCSTWSAGRPWRFVASLQYAQSCDEPILLRVTWGAGHSSGATVEEAVETWTDQLAFLIRTFDARGWRPASLPESLAALVLNLTLGSA